MADLEGAAAEHAGAVLRRLRYTGGRRVSQRALATLVGTSRAHIARLELHGFPPLTEEQLDRLHKAGDSVRPPFSRREVDELRDAMRAVDAAAVEQTNKVVSAIAVRAAQTFALWNTEANPAWSRPGEQPDASARTRSEGRPLLLTSLAQAADAVEEDIIRLAGGEWPEASSLPDSEPDLIMTQFAGRNLVEEAEEPERLRDSIIEVLRKGGTFEYLIARSAIQAPHDLVVLVPVMLYYLGQGGQRYRVHLIPEFEHGLAYGVYVAGDRGVLIAHGPGDQAIAVRADADRDVTALRGLVRPFWKDKQTIVEELGRRTTETVAGRTAGGPDPLRFDRVLTSVELEEGPRRLAKNGLSILNIPVAVQAWKVHAAELCTAKRIPEGLLRVLQDQAWELAEYGPTRLPSEIMDEVSRDSVAADALAEIEEYARGLRARQVAWTSHLSRYEFWDACPKSALIRFMATGEMPIDEMPPTCGYKAGREDIEIIVTRLITRLRSNRNYHLALIEELPFSKWFYLEVKTSHVLAQVFDAREGGQEEVRSSDDDMLSAHIDCAPIADAFAGWFDEHVLKTAAEPPWQDNQRVASWIEEKFNQTKRSW